MAADTPEVEELSSSNGRLRPVHAAGPIAGSIFALLGWAAVAHNSGSGWVQALGVVLGAVLVVGMIAPARFVSRAEIEVESSPQDAALGEPADIKVRTSTRLRIRPVSPKGPATFVGPVRASQPHSAQPGIDGETITIVPEHRGVLIAITVEVASAAPFGLLWWSKRTALALPAEMYVAPRPTTPLEAPPERDDTHGDSERRHAAMVGEPRGIRQYEQGDARRLVHWRATAHMGRLMVREMEEPTAEPITIRVSIPPDPTEADEVAGKALATVYLLLDRAQPVVLATHEPGKDRIAPVSGRREAGRRLARAVPFGSQPGSVTIDEPS
ncbi:MAG: DUF58 domain-containing protein [Acidimicrobiales bacterium]